MLINYFTVSKFLLRLTIYLLNKSPLNRNITVDVYDCDNLVHCTHRWMVHNTFSCEEAVVYN